MSILKPTAVGDLAKRIDVHSPALDSISRLPERVQEEVVLIVQLVFGNLFHVHDCVVIDPNGVIGSKLLTKRRGSNQHCQDRCYESALHISPLKDVTKIDM